MVTPVAIARPKGPSKLVDGRFEPISLRRSHSAKHTLCNVLREIPRGFGTIVHKFPVEKAVFRPSIGKPAIGDSPRLLVNERMVMREAGLMGFRYTKVFEADGFFVALRLPNVLPELGDKLEPALAAQKEFSICIEIGLKPAGITFSCQFLNEYPFLNSWVHREGAEPCTRGAFGFCHCAFGPTRRSNAEAVGTLATRQAGKFYRKVPGIDGLTLVGIPATDNSHRLGIGAYRSDVPPDETDRGSIRAIGERLRG